MIYRGRHLYIYFVITLTYCNFVRHAVESNLYSDFNNELDKVSNYAENRTKAETVATIGKIYDHNGKLVRKHLQNIQFKDVRNANTLNRNAEIEKLINALSSYHEPLSRQDTSDKMPLKSLWESHHQDFQYMNINKNKTKGLRKRLPRGNKLKQFTEYTSHKSSKEHIRKKRFIENSMKHFNPQSLLNTAASSYPNVVANLIDIGRLHNTQSSPPIQILNDDHINSGYINAVQDALQQEHTSQNTKLMNTPLSGLSTDYDLKARSASKESLPARTNYQTPAQQSPYVQRQISQLPNEEELGAQYSQFSTPEPYQAQPNRVKNPLSDLRNVLEKVLNELEIIKHCSSDNSTPSGTPCDIMGSWNSEVVGLNFDISSDIKGLSVDLHEREPTKRHTMMDTDWTCAGASLKNLGGPFYITAEKPEENTIAIFSGLCKKCGDTDTIFGSWTVIHPAKSCEDVHLAIETTRDIFRRSNFSNKKKERLDKINKAKMKAFKSKCT